LGFFIVDGIWAMTTLQDPFGRHITYLRISVTDRCNLRCVYCMPPEGVPWKSHSGIMRYEEILTVVEAAAQHGVREVRLTGGEPLVRPDLAELVRMIAAVPGIEDLSLTTNGVLLTQQAAELAAAGLTRVNISLDTLRPDKFKRITRGGSFDRTWAGIRAAEEAGLKPIKINVVAMRGINDDEIVDLARLTVDHPWSVRFIELMPVNNQQTWGEGFPAPEEIYLSIPEMLEKLEPYQLEPVEKRVGSGPAREYQFKNALGRVGFISPLSERFCSQCNRLRLTADGHLRPCLLSDAEVDLLTPLRAGQPVLPILEQAILIKPLEHQLSSNLLPHDRCMEEIGG
jgi:GTP 3',8-cyclase